MSEDTHEEQERLYPALLRQRDRMHQQHGSYPRHLPTRAEWAAPGNVRYDVQTQCFPSERIPRGAENYLSRAELDELCSLYRELCRETRPVLTAEIKRLRALLSSQPGARRRERAAWYLALDDVDQAIANRLSLLEGARRDLGRVLRGSGPGPDHDGLAEVAELVPSRDKLKRRAALLAKLESAEAAAGQAAEDAAIAREQSRRLTDEGWAQELRRREGLEAFFAGQPG